jgi:hypothetical protein
MILHKKRVLANRPDTPDPTLMHGLAQWDDDHNAPPFLAYAFVSASPVTIAMPNRNVPDTEIPNGRNRFDFSYVKSARIVVGVDYGSAKIFLKYSRDLKTWKSFDNAGGPFVQETQGNNNPTTYASVWVDLVDDAKADVWVAPFYRENTDTSIIHLSTIFFYVR